VIGAPGTRADEEDAILVPEDAGRTGPEPEIRQCVGYEAEAHAIGQWLTARHAAGYAWGQMAVLYAEHRIGQTFMRTLAGYSIPLDVAKGNRNRIETDRDAVRMLSMHNAKGLEFACVAIGGLGALGRSGKQDHRLEDDVRLTYVAITRATHEALLTYSRKSALVERLVA
jgi:superfamily I DNA/RNA helicase